MAFALVGSRGVVSQGAAGAAVTPAWGTGSNRTAGNLLVALVAQGAVNAVATISSGWTNAAGFSGGANAWAGIFYRIATGSDAAPTVTPGTGSGLLSVMLEEWSGSASSSVVDQAAGNGGTTSPLAVTASGVNAAPGELTLFAFSIWYTAAAIKTFTDSWSSNFTPTLPTVTDNAATSTAVHYHFADTAGNNTAAVADSDSFSYTVTKIGAAALVLASFKLASSDPFPTGYPENRSRTYLRMHHRGDLWLPEEYTERVRRIVH